MPDLPVTQSALLSECTPPTWNSKVARTVAPQESSHRQGQLEEAFRTYFVPAKNAEAHDIIAAHGNVIRWLMLKALDVDTRAWLGMSIAPASLRVIRVTQEGTH